MIRTMLSLLLVTLVAGRLSAQESFIAQQALEGAAEFDKAYAKLGRVNGELEQVTQRYRIAERKKDQQAIVKLGGVYRKKLAIFQAMRQLVQQKLKATIDKLDAAIHADKKNVKLYAARARMAGFRGRGEVAIDMLSKGLALAANDHVLRLERARYYFDLMRWTQALKDLDVCIEGGHRQELCEQYRGQVLFYSQKFSEALPIFTKLKVSKNKQIARVASNFHKLSTDYVGLQLAEQQLIQQETARNDQPRVKLVTTKGELLIELFEDCAPNTVANFINLVEKKFYDGTLFHRWEPNFMIQGGDPRSKDPSARPEMLGQGGPGYAIPDEQGPKARMLFSGYLAMAKRGNKPNTAGSQFFVTHVPAGWLNGRHTVFGRVITGLSIVRELRRGDKIVKIEVLRKRDHPYEPKKSN